MTHDAPRDPASPWTANAALRRGIETAFAPIAQRLEEGGEFELTQVQFQQLDEAVLSLTGLPELEFNAVLGWAETVRVPSPEPPDCAALARVYGFLWLEVLLQSEDTESRRALCLLAVIHGAVVLFEDAGEHTLGRALALQLEAVLQMNGTRARDLFERTGLDPDIALDRLRFEDEVPANHEAILESHSATMLAGARSCVALGDDEGALSLLGALDWIHEIPPRTRRERGVVERLTLEAKITARLGTMERALALAEQAVLEAPEEGLRRTMAGLVRARLRDQAGLDELFSEPIAGLPGWNQFREDHRDAFDARDRGSTVEHNPWLSLRGVLTELDALGHRSPRTRSQQVILDFAEQGEDALRAKHEELTELAATSGSVGIVCSILLAVLDEPSRPDFEARRFEALASAMDRGQQEVTDLGDLLNLDYWVTALLRLEGSDRIWSRIWEPYTRWMDFIGTALETWSEHSTPEQAIQDWRMDVGALMRSIEAVDGATGSMPTETRAHAHHALVRRVRAGLGRGLRHERAWKRASERRPPWLAEHMDALAQSAARGDWDRFGAERERMLLRTQQLRRTAATVLDVPRHGSLPELILLPLGRGSDRRLLTFDDFEGSLRRREQPLTTEPAALIDDVLTSVRVHGGLRRELVVPSLRASTTGHAAAAELARTLGFGDDLPRRFVLRAPGSLQLAPLSLLPGHANDPLGMSSVAVVGSGADDPATLLRTFEQPPRTLCVGDPTFGPGAAALPGTGVEADIVARLLPNVSPPLRGSDATRDALLQHLRAAPPEVLHLGTHAIAEVETPERSRLLLADAGTGTSDVLLFDEIAQLDLSSTRLVVLSACSTMRGSPRHAEGLLALSWAFKAAGADMVIAARWPVLDAEAPVFWEGFYTALVAHGDPCEAMLAGTHRCRDAGHGPEVWGVYQLIA